MITKPIAILALLLFSFTFLNTDATMLTFNSLTISKPNIVTMQVQTLTTNIYNGLPGYTYNTLVYNAVGALVANYLTTSTSTSSAFGYIQNPAWGIGRFTVNTIVTDSNTPTPTSNQHPHLHRKHNPDFASQQTKPQLSSSASQPSPATDMAPPPTP